MVIKIIKHDSKKTVFEGTCQKCKTKVCCEELDLIPDAMGHRVTDLCLVYCPVCPPKTVFFIFSVWQKVVVYPKEI